MNIKTAGALCRWGAAALAISVAGCKSCNTCSFMGDITPQPLGTISDPVFQQQEANAEASDFVVHEHEWQGNSTNLNDGGKHHLKQIAARAAETPFPIILQPSSMTARPDTEFGFAVHNNEELDTLRREYLVHALVGLGVQDAEQRVVVAPALTPGFQSFEAERAYGSGFGRSGMGGFGGGFGGGLGGSFGGGGGGAF